jgi:hypothetical protein
LSNMQTLGFLGMVLAIAISAIVQIFTDPRISRDFIYKSLIGLAVFAVHCAVGIVVMLYVFLPAGPDAAVAGVVAWFGWLGLGSLALVRYVPRLREPPRILLRVGILDLLCLLMVAGGIAAATSL